MYKRLEKLQVFTEFCGKLLISQRPVHFMVYVMAAKSWNRLGRVYIYTNLGFMLFLKTNYGLYTTGSCGLLLLCSKGSILPWIYCEIFASTERRDCRLRNYVITYLIFTVRHVMQCTVTILSVRLSVRCAYCDNTKWCTADILIPQKMAITLVFRHQHWLVGDASFAFKYSPKVTYPLRKTQTSTDFRL